MADVVNKEVAEKEVTKWLDVMDITEDRRKDKDIKDCIDGIIKGVCEGRIIFTGDEEITQVLCYPLGDGATKELKFDFRFEVGQYQQKMKGLTVTDAIAYNCAKLALVSADKLPDITFTKLKRKDFALTRQLAVFF